MHKILIFLNLISIFFIFQIKLGFVPLFPSNLNNDLASNINELIFKLSIGLITSSLFYLIVVYIPQKKREKTTLKIIQPRLNTIIDRLTTSIYYLKDKRLNLYNKNINSLKKEDFNSLTSLDNRKMDFKYQLFNANPEWTTYSLEEWTELNHFFDERELVISEIDKILEIPTIVYIDSEIIEILAALRDSWFYSGVKTYKDPLFKAKDGKTYLVSKVQKFDKGAYDYYILYLRLIKFGNITQFRVHKT